MENWIHAIGLMFMIWKCGYSNLEVKTVINFEWSIEFFISISVVLLHTLVVLLIVRIDWRKYGLLFLLSAVVGNILCLFFISFNFYSFPFVLFPQFINMPFSVILTAFPLYVLIGVRYSPQKWIWKIPFYWVFVHLGMLGETLALQYTELIKYEKHWDFWDSYTWWWIYLLIFEWIGGLIIPYNLRKPLGEHHLKFGKLGWFIVHFVLITTIFLGGVYLGMKL